MTTTTGVRYAEYNLHNVAQASHLLTLPRRIMEKSARYTIRIGSHLNGDLADWFAPLSVLNEPGGEAVLEGEMRDQAALHGVLAKIRDLNLPLIALERMAESHYQDSADAHAATEIH